MERAIWAPPVRIFTVKKPPTRRLSSLPLEAARQYGLLDEKWDATDLTIFLDSLDNQPLYEAFARHILINCGGLRVVEGAEQMTMDEPRTHVPITGDTLAAYLSDQGFRVTVHNTAINTMRLWLEKAGIFGSDAEKWKVNPQVKERLLGISNGEISALVNLSEEEKAFVIALCRINPQAPYPAATVREVAETIIGHRMDRSSLPKLMQPIKDAGFIDFDSRGTASGKSAWVWTTTRFKSDILEPILTKAVEQLDAVLTDYYKRDFDQIYRDLDSEDTFVKGQALEAFTIQIMRMLGLRFIQWRLRAKDQTGGAEVDAVLGGVLSTTPSRWQIQCKNTPSGQVHLNEVAKEVGLLPLTKATQILIIANCRFSKDAVTYAREVMKHTSVSIFLLDRDDFAEIRKTSGGALARILALKAHDIAALERLGLEWVRK
ncbi:MAG: restriction endonuclease [Thermoplasmatales archaeon]